jgi:pimeloyl-ACP methyl ester carboxylesterase
MAAASGAASTLPSGQARSTITWTPCHEGTGFPFECGSLRVPLNYSDPHGPAIRLALVRLPASDPGHRIGSLFLNPGGPGGSGVDFALGVAPFLYGGAIQSSFDIIGFDPRGINRSTPLRCFDSPDEWDPIFTPFAFPRTPREELLWRQADLYLVRNCAHRAGPILEHMATADAARDLDRMRAAVGDEKLSYMGVSYGSYLGVTYANMFPNHVRAVIVDGVLDPIAWATGVDGEAHTVPFSTRLRSDMGAKATLDEFFRLCDRGGSTCAFAPHSSDRFQRLAHRLSKASVALVDSNTGPLDLDYSVFILNALIAMYDSPSWPSFAQFLADLEARLGPRKLGESLQRLQVAEGLRNPDGTPRYHNDVEGFPGVACSDSENPSSYQVWSEQGTISEERFGYFGRIWTWISSICAKWPGADAQRYLGLFDHRTSQPVLVIGNFFDPATRYQGAQLVHQLLPNSALLSLRGWGHTSLFLSRCVDRIAAAYLLRIDVPPSGKICQQDQVPFHSSAAPTAGSSLRASVIASLLPGPLLRGLG